MYTSDGICIDKYDEYVRPLLTLSIIKYVNCFQMYNDFNEKVIINFEIQSILPQILKLAELARKGAIEKSKEIPFKKR